MAGQPQEILRGAMPGQEVRMVDFRCQSALRVEETVDFGLGMEPARVANPVEKGGSFFTTDPVSAWRYCERSVPVSSQRVLSGRQSVWR